MIVRATRRVIGYVCKTIVCRVVGSIEMCKRPAGPLATSKISLRASFALQYPEKRSKFT